MLLSSFYYKSFLFLSHRYIDDLANIYHQERLPWIKTIQGVSLTIQCGLSEIPVFVLSGKINTRYNARTS